MTDNNAGTRGRLTRLFEGFPYKRPHLITALRDARSSWFVNGPDEPAAGVVCHPAGHVFLAGDPTCSGPWDFLETQLAQREDPRRPLMLIPPAPVWEQAITERLGNRALPSERTLMLPTPDVEISALPPGSGVVVSDMATVAPDTLKNMMGLRRNWGSVEAFQADGVGFQAIVSQEAVSVCFAVAVAEGGAPIQISTEREHQRRGYARLVAEQFILRCRECDFVPHWECDESNEASYQLALSLGFATHLSFTRYHLQST